MMDEVFLLPPGERDGLGREQDVLGVCTQECDVCLDGLVGVGQDLQAVLGVLVCAGVVTRHPGTRGGDEANRRCAHTRRSDGSVRRAGLAEIGGTTSTLDLGGDDDGDKRRWKVVLCCVALSYVVLCCVVLCCVVLCCVVLVVLRCVVLCCVVLCWLCCVVLC